MSHNTSLDHLTVGGKEAFEDALGYLHDRFTSPFGDDAIKAEAAYSLGDLLLRYITLLGHHETEWTPLDIPVIR